MAEKARKISEEEFWTAVRKSAGLYSRTARLIEKLYGVKYSRQAVKDRAEKKPLLLADIEDESIDIAEEGLHELMRPPTLPKVRLQAIALYLKTKGKKRGYVERIEQTGANGGAIEFQQTNVIKPKIENDGDSENN